MINRLLDDCFRSELNTIVKEVREDNFMYWHALKETIFFKESGGMGSDIGVINNHEVLDLKEEDGMLWHLLDIKLEGQVHVSINLHERFRKCQIHTAQHLISALLSNVYKVKTLSHHVSDEENDIEFDFESFSDKHMIELQILCNGLIRDDLKVSILYPTAAQVKEHIPHANVDYDELRVVRIGTIDYNLCGCMHVPSLRYIQIIKILGYEKSKHGYKIKYICGDQLLDCLSRRYHVLDEAGKTLALSHLYVNTGINKLVNETRNLKGDIVVWKQKYYELVAKEMSTLDEPIIIREFSDIDVKSLSQLTNYIVKDHKKVLIFVAKIYDTCQLVVATHKDVEFDCMAFYKEVADKFNLKGGGNQSMAQGGGIYRSEIIEYINSVIKH